MWAQPLQSAAIDRALREEEVSKLARHGDEQPLVVRMVHLRPVAGRVAVLMRRRRADGHVVRAPAIRRPVLELVAKAQPTLRGALVPLDELEVRVLRKSVPRRFYGEPDTHLDTAVVGRFDAPELREEPGVLAELLIERGER